MKSKQQILYRLVVIISALAVLVMFGKEHVGAAFKHQQSSQKMILVK